MDQTFYFKGITLLVTVYNRSRSLERLLAAFERLNCRFDDIVVSDDGSRDEHLNAIRGLQSRFEFRLLTTPENKGLGHNINKGQDAVHTPYTLYVQEDFVPRDVFPACLQESLRHMNEREDIDIVRFYSYFKYPCLKPIKEGLAEMYFNPAYPGYRKFYMYSDHPHLRRSNFLQKFGRYTEGKKMDKTEYEMMQSFLRKKGKALYFENHKEIFDQLNSPDEPSTIKRRPWTESNNPVIAVIRDVYRHVKFRCDYLLGN
ncbi:MAG: glycosyltransferase family A protein [Bacteroidota bacterium]